MNYPELCERLIRETGHADVYYAQYPHLGTGATGRQPRKILLVHDGVFDVGNKDPDRGGWNSAGQFATIEEACECMYEWATWVAPPPRKETPEEKRRSEEIMAEHHAKRQAERDAWVAAYRAREGLDPEPSE